jgi:hypothetical protein
MVDKVADTTIKQFDPENIGVASGISFLSALELKISLAELTIIIALGGLSPQICEFSTPET